MDISQFHSQADLFSYKLPQIAQKKRKRERERKKERKRERKKERKEKEKKRP